MSGGRKIELVSDNDPKHSSADFVAFYKLKNINRLDWSPYSPDFNSFEYIWDKTRSMNRTKTTMDFTF